MTDADVDAPQAMDSAASSNGGRATAHVADAAMADLAAMPFDRALAELQSVVSRLETGGLPLEDSIDLYERGVALHDRCSKLLTGAELRVQRLVEQAGGKLRTVDLSVDDEA